MLCYTFEVVSLGLRFIGQRWNFALVLLLARSGGLIADSLHLRALMKANIRSNTIPRCLRLFEVANLLSFLVIAYA